MKLDTILVKLLNHLELEQGYSKNTIKTYKIIIQKFNDYVLKHRVSKVKKKHIEDFVVHLRDVKKNTAKSIRLKLAALKTFFKYATEKLKIYSASPIGDDEFKYKVERKEIKTISEKQVGDLLNAIYQERDNLLSPKDLIDNSNITLQKRILAIKRDIILIKLFLSTGIRVSEALNIRISNIDYIDKSIKINGKGNKIRSIFFDLEALEKEFIEYINEIIKLNLKLDFIFINIKNYKPLTARAVQMLLKKYIFKAGLSKSITPHILRHTFASLSIERGANIKVISQLLGHSNIQITINTYTHLSNEYIRDVMKLCNPLSNKIIPIAERIENRKRSLIYLNKTG